MASKGSECTSYGRVVWITVPAAVLRQLSYAFVADEWSISIIADESDEAVQRLRKFIVKDDTINRDKIIGVPLHIVILCYFAFPI